MNHADDDADDEHYHNMCIMCIPLMKTLLVFDTDAIEG